MKIFILIAALFLGALSADIRIAVALISITSMFLLTATWSRIQS